VDVEGLVDQFNAAHVGVHAYLEGTGQRAHGLDSHSCRTLDRRQHVRRKLALTLLFEPRIAVRAHARLHRHLFPAQPGHRPTFTSVDQPGISHAFEERRELRRTRVRPAL
jgi:hypothetical protein